MLPLRLVLDTNILVSAALNPDGLQRTTLLLALTKPARLYVTLPILEEYAGVLQRPYIKVRRGERLRLLQLIKNRSYVIRSTRRLAVASDPDDDMFLECADAARADYLITGPLPRWLHYLPDSACCPRRNSDSGQCRSHRPLPQRPGASGGKRPSAGSRRRVHVP